MEFKKIRIIFIIIFSFLIFPNITLANNGEIEGQNYVYEKLFEGFVYYSNDQKTALKAVKKSFSSSLDGHSLGIEILTALIKGPGDNFLKPTWPADTKINAFFITDDGDAFVDLDLEPSMVENMDTASELLAVYSMVNSLALNIPEIKQVKILLQGKDADTLAGHIGLEHYYKANMLIVK